jgi:hypothetical protein
MMSGANIGVRMLGLDDMQGAKYTAGGYQPSARV